MPDIVVQPVAIAQQARTPSLGALNYTNQDYGSLKIRLRDLIREKFTSDFTDLFESSLAVMMMELFAFAADTVNFKIDQTACEVFIDSVGEVENAFRLARLVGFNPTPPIAARAMFSATIPSVLDADLTVPAGTSIPVVTDDNEPINYQLYPADSQGNPLLDEDIVIPAGNVSNTRVVGLEGQTRTDSFVGSGQTSQSFALTATPVIYDSIRVEVDGIRWTQVDYFTDSQKRREFRVEFDSSWQGFVIFGNSRSGLLPSNGSRIAVTYRVGGGTRGNIVTGAATVQRNFVVNDLGFPIPVSFANYTRGEYGYNGDGIEEVRQKLPAYLQTQGRAVTGSDYKTLTDQFVTPHLGQVGKSVAVLRNDGCSGNIVDIYLLARDGDSGLQTATDQLKYALRQELNSKRMASDYVCLRDGTVVLTDVTIDVVVDKFFSKLKEEINVKLLNRISQFFSLTNWEFGQTLRDTDLIKAMSDVAEAEQFDVTFTTDDPDNSGQTVSTRYYEIIRPDSINLSFTFQ